MNLSIRDFHISHMDELLQISNLCFGKNYIIKGEISQRQSNSNCSDYVLINDNKLVGFCFLNSIIDEASYPFSNTLFSSKYFPMGMIKSIAIDPNYQLQGKGSFLLSKMIEYFKENSHRSIIYPAWVENNHDHFLNKLNHFNFKTIKTYPNYWSAESKKENYKCLRCGNPPCTCSMKLFKLDL